MGVYQPLYLFLFVLLLGIILPVIIYTISKFKFNFIGVFLIALSIISYLTVGAYMVGAGYYADGGYYDEGFSGTLFNIGLPELTLLSYPYIFICLSVILGKKGNKL